MRQGAAFGSQIAAARGIICVTLDGDHATATAYLLVLISQNDSHRTLPPGRYECELVKRNGQWLFSRRTVFHDHDYTLEGIGKPS